MNPLSYGPPYYLNLGYEDFDENIPLLYLPTEYQLQILSAAGGTNCQRNVSRTSSSNKITHKIPKTFREAKVK